MSKNKLIYPSIYLLLFIQSWVTGAAVYSETLRPPHLHPALPEEPQDAPRPAKKHNPSNTSQVFLREEAAVHVGEF